MLRKENRRVFTAIEIFIAILVIFILIFAVSKAYSSITQKGNKAVLDSDITNVCKMLNLYNTSSRERIVSLTDEVPELKLSVDKGDPFDHEYIIEITEERWQELTKLIEFNGSQWVKKK